MGLAASQARLLSITSRMADNELRSQIINNAKMRLTTESSKASEEYITALNKTQLMMTNYDATNEKRHQDLTFNSMTQYSALNNQYGLVNKSGELLVSELDTARYQNAFVKAKEDKEIEEGDTEGLNAKALEEFLKQYGLEKSTTYFEQDAVYAFGKDMQRIYEGDMVYEYIPATDTTPPEAVRVSGLHYGYEKSKTSVEYGVYEKLLSDYKSADSKYTEAVKKDMKDHVYGLTGSMGKYEEVYKQLIGAGGATAGNYKNYQAYMKEIWGQISGKLNPETSETFKAGMEEYMNMAVGQQQSDTRSPAPNRADYTGAIIDSVNKTITWNLTDPNALPAETTGNYDPDGTGEEWTEIINSPLTEQDVIDSIKQMYQYFQSGILLALDRSQFVISTQAKEAQADYYAKSEKLSQFIFGQNISKNLYEHLDDMEWIIYGPLIDPKDPSQGRTNAPLFPTTALDPSEGGVSGATVDVDGKENGANVTKTYDCNFQAIKDVYLCDKMMELFGTPKYTWIDVNNPDENAEAKAKWYTNLFERMTEGGYKTLEKGLASSQEWLQFALESGLVTMEQVNKDGDWISTSYTNCSDITESTIDVDITIAEAEYQKAVNKIQAKDKRFDMELKNIDTEHTSLQTEYDSIKSVMDKNVERNFKMFEA